jgi:iron complex outermembrane receptor protein
MPGDFHHTPHLRPRRAMRNAWPALIAGGLALCPVGAAAQTPTSLRDLSIEELSAIEITSVSKKAEPLSGAPASIYVLTRDDIVRSGATTLPEMLRRAPNLQVAQVAGGNYAITARGFNGPAADKLLVLIDGRSIYTPFFSGVIWSLHSIVPDDIERIEVISGPGATMWGANAVNGVINVITRSSADSQGGVLHLGGGTNVGRGSLTYGGRLSDELTYRASILGFDEGANLLANGADGQDRSHNVQGSFRLDWTPADDVITLQGDVFRGAEQQLNQADQRNKGQNVLARWSHPFDNGAELRVQAYYNHISLVIPNYAANYVDTYDVEAQYGFSWGRQDIVVGGGYRSIHDDFPTTLTATQRVQFIPQSRTLGLANVFVQDTISLSDTVKLIPGIKLEDEPYTGVEVLPSLRASWQVNDSNTVWAAVSRAIRSPSRLDRDTTQTAGSIVTIAGGNFQPVEVVAYELGYRTQPIADLSLSVSTFYNVYDGLRSAEPTNGGFPITFENGLEGDTYGVEFWANYRVNEWWALAGGFNWLRKDLRFKPGSAGLGGLGIAGNDPAHQITLRSSMNLTQKVTLDIDWRQIDDLPAPASPAYTELGARVAWAVSDSLVVSLTGANLLHAHHAEFGTTPAPLQLGRTGVRVGRNFFFDARWVF